MASAYELMLVLRGRNYLSNDLRRAGADIGHLRAAGQIRSNIANVSASRQRLANARALAQAEQLSLVGGVKRQKLDQLITSQGIAQEKSAINVRNAHQQLATIESQRLRNLAQVSQLSRVQKAVGTPAEGVTSGRAFEVQQRLNAAQLDTVTIAEKAKIGQQALTHAEEIQAAAALKAQQVIKTATDANITQQLKAAETIRATTVEINTQVNALTRLDVLATKADFYQGLDKSARYVEHLGRAFQTLGLFSTAALGYAAYSASKFNTSITLAATQSTTTSNNTTQQVLRNAKVLQAAVQQLLVSGATPVKSADLSGGLYTIFSGLSLPGGQKQQLKEGLSILKEFSTVFTANFGQVDFNTVTKTGIALINNFGLSAAKLPAVMNQMQASVRFGAMTMGEMTSSLNQVIPAFKAAGYSTKQMFEDIAFVSRVFPNLRIGTTGLARLTETFGKYHDAISQSIGTNIAPGGNLLPVAKIVQDIVKADPKILTSKVNLQNYFKTVTGSSQFVNARRVFTAYATSLGLYHDVAGKVAGDNNELAKSFADMNQTPQVRWAEFTNQLRGLVLEIGTNALPIFQKMAGPIKDAVHWFDTLSPSTRKWAGELAAILSVATLFGGTLLVIVGALARVYAAYKLFRIGRAATGIMSALGGGEGAKAAGVAGLASEAGFVSARVALGLGAAAAIPLLIMYHKQVGEVVNALGGLKNVITLFSGGLLAVTFLRLARTLLPLIANVRTAEEAVALLRTNFLGLAGLVVTATVIILERHKIEGAVRTALGDKGPLATIDPFTGVASHHVSFGQQLSGEFLGGGLLGKTPQDMRGERDKLAQLYREFAAGTNKMMSPGTLNQFASFLKEFGITTKSSAKDVQAAIFAFTHPSGFGVLTRGLKGVVAEEKNVVSHTKAMRIQFEHGIGAMSAGVNILSRTAAVRNVKQFEVMMKQIDRIVALHSKAEVSGLAKDWLAYFTLLNATTKKYSGNLLQTFNQMLDTADKKTTAGATNTASNLQDLASNVMSMYDELLSQNQSVMGTLFQGPFLSGPLQQNTLQWGGKFSGKDYLKDIKSQVFQFKEFYGYINQLQRRGAPQELIQQIIAAGPSALPAIRALKNMAPQQWKAYISVFNEGQRLLHNQTIAQLKTQLSDYRKYGNNIAVQIIEGMRDKRVGLTNEIKSIIKNMFGVSVPEVRKHGKAVKDLSNATHAARQTHATHHGASVYSTHTTHTRPIVGTHNRAPQVVHHTTNYNITAPKSEHGTLTTQLRHADFVIRTKYGKR